MRTLGLGKSSYNPTTAAKHWPPTNRAVKQDSPNEPFSKKESSNQFIPVSPTGVTSPRATRSSSPKSVVNLPTPSKHITKTEKPWGAGFDGIKTPDTTRKSLSFPNAAVHTSPRAGTKHRPSLAVQNDLLNSPLASRRGFSFAKKADIPAPPFSPSNDTIASPSRRSSVAKKQKWIATPTGIKLAPPPPPPAKCFDWKANVLSPRPTTKPSLQRAKRFSVQSPPPSPPSVHQIKNQVESKDHPQNRDLPPSILRRHGKFSGSTHMPATPNDEDKQNHLSFSDQIETIDTYQVPAEEFSLFFYDHEEIAQFRHDAFAEELGLDASDYHD